MVKDHPYIAVQGDFFSPTKAEQETGLKFSNKAEVGDIGNHGRFKGRPYPFGHAVLEAPEVMTLGKLDWLLDSVTPHKATLKQLGVTDGKVHVTYAYDSQCNLEYPPEIVEKLAKLGFAFTITCYQDES